MKRTLKRESKVLEIVEGEGIGSRLCTRALVGNSAHYKPWLLVSIGYWTGIITFHSERCMPARWPRI